MQEVKETMQSKRKKDPLEGKIRESLVGFSWQMELRETKQPRGRVYHPRGNRLSQARQKSKSAKEENYFRPSELSIYFLGYRKI